MAYNEGLSSQIREALADVANVDEKRMFRGVTFMVDGKMCISAGDNIIMVRIDPALHDEALEKPGCSTVIMRGRPYKGYVHVDMEFVKNKADLDYWINLALDYNPIARASTKKKD